ncbi:MAG: hypothetical protein GEU73_07210 [Chloroflexi bacterium]|nr:hypothetical protein [Chloroflexota bacterium]
MSVIEQHIKTFECDACKTQIEQEPQITQIEGWVRVVQRNGSSTRMWDFCSWECVGSAVADGAPAEDGLTIEDEPRGRRRRADY